MGACTSPSRIGKRPMRCRRSKPMSSVPRCKVPSSSVTRLGVLLALVCERLPAERRAAARGARARGRSGGCRRRRRPAVSQLPTSEIGQQARAVGLHHQARPAAEARRRRGQHQPAAKFERAEPLRRPAGRARSAAIGRASISMLSMPAGAAARILSWRGRIGPEASAAARTGEQAAQQPAAVSEAARRVVMVRSRLAARASAREACDHSMQLAARQSAWSRRGACSGAPSSNSSTSLSVMAPASSVGSVMVTARR